MSGDIIDWSAPSLRGGVDRRPEDLPHGLIVPPPEVRALLAKEKTKHPPQCWPPAIEERTLNHWTLGYYFDYLGHEVLYRQTPEGPEVLAVGWEEIFALRQKMPQEELLKLQTWLPY
jgi:hypothetical protein